MQSKNTVTLALDEYNKSEPLMIDPQLTYSTYLGGAGNDSGNGIAVDAAGNAYVTGETASAGSVPFQSSLGGNCTTCKNVFVTKL